MPKAAMLASKTEVYVVVFIKNCTTKLLFILFLFGNAQWFVGS